MDSDRKNAGPTPPAIEISVEDIAYYYDEMVRSNLLELEVETPQGKITLKRRESKEVSTAAFLKRRRSDLADASAKEEAGAASFKSIPSPIMGMFYRSSSPQSPPFVKEGETVAAGATVCIVEAMKVMNEIKTEVRCKVVKILVENGKPVTKGQALFQIEPIG